MVEIKKVNVISILDKLIEKKDVEAYLEMRALFLKSIMEDAVLSVEPEKRELIRERFYGRIHELKMTIETIRNNTLKDDSKMYYRQLHKND